MIINNKNISSFSAKVERKIITPSEIETRSEWLSTSLIPKSYGNKISFKNINIELLFKGENRDLILKNISNFTKELIECDIKFKNISNNFHCFIVSTKPLESEFDDWLFLNVELKGYEYSDETIFSIDSVAQQTIENVGNMKTPAVLEITPKGNVIELTIEGLNEDGITIKNLKNNQKVIIDSLNGTILEGNINKFTDVDLWEFPFLFPGLNVIKLNRTDVNIKIKFKPMWI